MWRRWRPPPFGLALGAKPPDSLLEETMAALFRDHALPPFEFHAVVAGWEVDFLVAGTTVVLECDGWTTHGLDRKRPAWVAERVRGTLRRWAPELTLLMAG